MPLLTAIPILVAHIEFLIEGYRGQKASVDQGVNSNSLFSFESVNEKGRRLAFLGGAHTTEVRLYPVHSLWGGILRFQPAGTPSMESLERLDDKYYRSV